MAMSLFLRPFVILIVIVHTCGNPIKAEGYIYPVPKVSLPSASPAQGDIESNRVTPVRGGGGWSSETGSGETYGNAKPTDRSPVNRVTVSRDDRQRETRLQEERNKIRIQNRLLRQREDRRKEEQRQEQRLEQQTKNEIKRVERLREERARQDREREDRQNEVRVRQEQRRREMEERISETNRQRLSHRNQGEGRTYGNSGGNSQSYESEENSFSSGGNTGRGRRPYNSDRDIAREGYLNQQGRTTEERREVSSRTRDDDFQDVGNSDSGRNFGGQKGGDDIIREEYKIIREQGGGRGHIPSDLGRESFSQILKDWISQQSRASQTSGGRSNEYSNRGSGQVGPSDLSSSRKQSSGFFSGTSGTAGSSERGGISGSAEDANDRGGGPFTSITRGREGSSESSESFYSSSKNRGSSTGGNHKNVFTDSSHTPIIRKQSSKATRRGGSISYGGTVEDDDSFDSVQTNKQRFRSSVQNQNTRLPNYGGIPDDNEDNTSSGESASLESVFAGRASSIGNNHDTLNKDDLNNRYDTIMKATSSEVAPITGGTLLSSRTSGVCPEGKNYLYSQNRCIFISESSGSTESKYSSVKAPRY